ncbi:MAG: HD domain-containing phosphohydrolase [Gemmatimonadaceae bacterium]|nr:HD domain-containing phosphohydrolase [Gemmatimonadaceae bacterium]
MPVQTTTASPAARPSTPVHQPAQGAESSDIPIAELLAALSHALDLTEGAPAGHTLRSCMIAMRIGDSIGLPSADRTALYYAMLLKDAGCSSNAARITALFGSDDHIVKPRMKIVDANRKLRLAIETFRNAGGGKGLRSRIAHFMGIARGGGVTRELIAIRCERGASIARQMGFPEATCDAIRSLDEHWNGLGHPEGLREHAIPLLARIANLAQTIDIFVGAQGIPGTMQMIRDRRKSWFDPQLCDLVLRWRKDTAWWTWLRESAPEIEVTALEPADPQRVVNNRGLDLVAQSFADIVDAKSPFTYRHSTNVSRWARAVGAKFFSDEHELTRLARAGLLHDVGKLGVSNTILDKNGPLGDDERTLMQAHPIHTWEILRRVRVFSDFAKMASLHHEKLDGSGYPWKVPAEGLDLQARILVVADIFEALTADRPYRAGMPIDAALSLLEKDRDRKLDGRVLDALAQATTEMPLYAD